MQKITILNKATYIILGLVMVGVVYFAYQKPKEVSPEIMLAKREIRQPFGAKQNAFAGQYCGLWYEIFRNSLYNGGL